MCEGNTVTVIDLYSPNKENVKKWGIKKGDKLLKCVFKYICISDIRIANESLPL